MTQRHRDMAKNLGLDLESDTLSWYEQQRKWADDRMPAVIEALLSTDLVTDPLRMGDFKEDTREATDLVDAEGRRIAVRVRSWTSGFKLPELDRTMWVGAPKEDEALHEGLVRYYFCAVARPDEEGPVLDRWFVVDLDVFRALDVGHPRYLDTWTHKKSGKRNKNYLVFDYPGLVVASWRF